MNVTLDYLKSNRKWLVRDFQVWGDDGAVEADILATENDISGSKVVYLREFSGGLAQVVHFDDLTDHRGNPLPSTLDNPEVILIPKNGIISFVQGIVGPSAFRIARERLEPAYGLVDLLILEMC